MHKIWVFLLSIASLFRKIVISQFPANCAFVPQEIQLFCVQLMNLDVLTRREFQRLQQNGINLQSSPVFFLPWTSTPIAEQTFESTPLDCMDLLCLCPYFQGQIIIGNVCILPSGRLLQKAIRKEYRMLTNRERNRYHAAVQRLKESGDYDRLSKIHQEAASMSGAHSGPAFLPWHREYIKRIEIALRLIDPSLALPYWDSVMDSYLENGQDSIVWSPLFAGETDRQGNIINGPYAGFRTLEGDSFVTRKLGDEGRLFTEFDIMNVLNHRDISNIFAFTAPQPDCPFEVNNSALEYSHGGVHLWVGGEMKPVIRSANEPLFFLHHSFVDYIWEEYRQIRQNRREREEEYAPDLPECANPMHFKNAVMLPFNKLNGDGLSNAYTDNLYEYAPRPTCDAQQLTCGSPYLFCDIHNGPPHCVSKIKINGVCRDFEEENACFQGVCIGGVCRPRSESKPTRNLVQDNSYRRLLQSWNSVLIRLNLESCFNDNPCCSLWAAQGECVRNQPFMSRFCKRSCGICHSILSDTNECIDRHPSCASFSSQSYCTIRRQWMAENCRKSCALCEIPFASSCTTVPLTSGL